MCSLRNSLSLRQATTTSMTPPSPAHRRSHPQNAFAGEEDCITPTKPLEKQDSAFGRWLARVHDRLVMKLVCCAPASVVLEVELEEEDFCRPDNTEVQKIEPRSASARGLLLKKQKSASVAPVARSNDRESSDRDIPTNEELENLPIDLSFVLDDSNDDASNTSVPIPHPPATPRHAALAQRTQQLAAFRQNQSARVIQRRWRINHTPVEVDDESSKTDIETDTEETTTERPTKTRRRRIRKHRGRKKKNSN